MNLRAGLIALADACCGLAALIYVGIGGLVRVGWIGLGTLFVLIVAVTYLEMLQG